MQMTIEQWEYVKPYLVQFGYIIDNMTPKRLDNTNNLIVLNFGSFGHVTNLSIDRKSVPSRYLVTDLDKFLTIAAKLKGCIYQKNDLTKPTVYSSYKELLSHTLKQDDIVKFTIKEECITYKVYTNFLHTFDAKFSDNDIIFNKLEIKNKYNFCNHIYGYESASGDWPECKYDDYEALTNLCLVLFTLCKQQNIQTTDDSSSIVIKSNCSSDPSLIFKDAGTSISASISKNSRSLEIDNTEFSFKKRSKNNKRF